MPTRYLGGEIWLETTAVAPADRSLGWDVAGHWLQALYETPLLFAGILDGDGTILDANELSIEGCGLDRSVTVGRPFWEGGWWSPDPELADQIRRWCGEVVTSGRALRTTSRYFVGDGSVRMVDLSLHPVYDEHPSGGRRAFVVAYGLDITDTLVARAEREERLRHEATEQERLARRRHDDLVASVEAERLIRSRLAQLARAAVDMVGADSIEALTDIVFNAAFPILDAAGGAVVIRDGDELRVHLSDHMDDLTRARYTEAPLDSPLPGRYVARTGQPLLFPDRATGLSFLPEMAQVYADTGRHAWAYFPLVRGDRVLGSLAISWRDEREFGQEELALMESIAAQCAQVVDHLRITRANAEHAEQVASMVESMQRSLLNSSPTSEGLDVATVYLPAGQAVQVGGDWYDAFRTEDGGSLLVVGDVAGHDGDAAATMAQLRNLFRGMAFRGGRGPAQLLELLDDAIVVLDLDAVATMLVAEVRPSEPDADRLCVRWASAGHLPPVLRHTDGRADVIEEKSEVLLGTVERARRTDHELEVPDGAVLLFYTDGLIERRGEPIDVGRERLRAVVERTPVGDSRAMCAAVVEALVPEAPDDDVVVLAVRRREGPSDCRPDPRVEPAP